MYSHMTSDLREIGRRLAALKAISNPAPIRLVHRVTPNGCAPPAMAIFARENEYPQTTPRNNRTIQAQKRLTNPAGGAVASPSIPVDGAVFSKDRSSAG